MNEVQTMYKKILVPVDGSPTATSGLNEAIRLAKDQGSQLRLVHVVNELVVVSPDASGANLGRVIDVLRADGESLLDSAEAAARAAGVEVDTVLVEEMGGQAGVAILHQAEEWAADLIACGTHGRRGIRRLVLGSDAEYIVRHTPVPVLLVRSSAS
jgi:nucleotide-binding universal stress UspA family protein